MAELDRDIIDHALNQKADPLDVDIQEIDNSINEAIMVVLGERHVEPATTPEQEGYYCPVDSLLHELEWGEANFTVRCSECNHLYLITQCRPNVFSKGTVIQMILDVIKTRNEVTRGVIENKVSQYAQHYDKAKKEKNVPAENLMKDRIAVLRTIQEQLGL